MHVLPPSASESLWYDDRGTLRQIPIVGWNITEDAPMPITAIGTFYVGQAYAVHYDVFFVVMPDRVVTRSHEEMKRLVLGRQHA
ncbi:hypothetical protein ABIA41_006420 [Bradyrhizobium sp. USDA 313]